MRLGKGDEDIRQILDDLPPGAAAQYVKEAIRSRVCIIPLLLEIRDAVKHDDNGAPTRV